MLDLTNAEVRKTIVDEINQEENHSRKREHQKRFDVYRERQDQYILERLQREFSPDTVSQMRKIFSINLTTRIIDELSSIYNQPPERMFGGDPSENELAQLESFYDSTDANAQLRNANRFYNLHDQCALMCVPDKYNGGFKIKAIPPQHYDVIPDPENPERAFAYVLNVWDYDLYKTTRNENTEPTQLSRYRQNDRRNQKIADDNDRLAELERYVVWTNDLHFTMNGKGALVGEMMPNPLGRLPFVDVATDKDFQFFVRRGTSVVDFALDFGLILSDTANTIRMQNYSQAIMLSEKQPQNLVIGPNHVLWLPLNPTEGAQPKFEFASPNPDIAGTLEFAEMTLRLFLASRGIDPATISGKGETRSFSSGIERLLAMLDKFEATRSDFDLFKRVESELFEIMVGWSNIYQSVTGPGEFPPGLRLATIRDDVFLDVDFSEPQAIQTKSELEESVIRLMEAGLMSRREAIVELRGVSPEKADEILMEVDEIGGQETDNAE